MTEAVTKVGLSSGRVWSLVGGLLGAAACVVGSTMTWVQFGAVSFRVSATTGLDYPTNEVRVGQICLVVALVGAATLLLAQMPGARFLAVVTVLAGMIAGGFAVLFRAAIEDEPSSVLDVPLDRALDLVDVVNNGPGSVVVTFGGAVLAVAGIVTLVTARSAGVVRAAAAPRSSSTARRAPRRPDIAVPDLSPNWLPDPAGRFDYRFWDGNRWTARVSRGGIESADPPSVA